MRMARRVSSNSAMRASRSVTCEERAACFFRLGTSLLLIGLDIQAENYAILIGKIADQAAQWQRHGLDQGRRGDDLARRSHGRLLIDIHDFKVKLVGKVFVAQGAKIFNGLQRAGSLPSDVQTQSVAG